MADWTVWVSPLINCISERIQRRFTEKKKKKSIQHKIYASLARPLLFTLTNEITPAYE